MNMRLPRFRLGLVTLVIAAFAVGELLWLLEASAHPTTGSTAPIWSNLEEGQLTLARRRRRRRRRPKRHSKRTTKKKKKKAAEESPEAAPAANNAGTDDPPTPGGLRRGARVEFDGRLVQGQTAKSGAIYLFARKRSELRSMVKERQEYRKEILRTVYPSYEK